jgi:hypothetical protein
MTAPDPGQHFALLLAARKRFSAGGSRRLQHTLPPTAFSALNVVRRLCVRSGTHETDASSAIGPSPKEVCQEEPLLISTPAVCSRLNLARRRRVCGSHGIVLREGGGTKVACC